MFLLVVYIAVALGFSFLCSMLEAIVLSVTPSYIARLQQEGRRVGARLRDLKTNVDRPLAAILSLNTVAHTVGAAGAGAQAQAIWGSEALAATSVVLTLLILIVSEIIPKTLGAVHWRRLAPWAARILPPLMVALYPLVIMSELITRLMARRSSTGTATVSREEIAAMAHLGREEGIFGESESRILRNLFRIGSLRARDIMTPRPVMFSLPSSTTVRQVLDRKGAKQFSRIPIWQENEDDVVGYVLTDEVLLYGARDELDRSLEDFKRDMLVVPDSLPVATFFEQLLDRREHIALIVDEWGGVAGIATMEDVVETLLGLEIVDEADTVQDMREMARKRWTRRAKRLGVVPSDYPEPAAGAKPSRGRE